ncbi:ribbon-helix-helix domain-containing protein [Nostoc sp. UIC 10890]
MLYTAISSELMARPRITVTVSDDVYQYLNEWADREERPLANLAAYLLSQAVREHQEQSESAKPKKGKGTA